MSGSVSTTFGGVPRVCRGPATHCTTAYGGIRTSVDAAGRLHGEGVGEQPGAGGERLAVVGDAEPGSASFKSSVWTTSSTVRVTR